MAMNARWKMRRTRDGGEGGGREECNFTPVAGNFTLLLGQVSKAQLVLVENVVPVHKLSSAACSVRRPRFKGLLAHENADGNGR